MSLAKAIAAIRKAETVLKDKCQDPMLGRDCERACIYGGMTVVSEILRAYEADKRLPDYMKGIKGAKKPKAKGIGIIVSPMDDCPEGFEEIFVKTPRNKRVKICRLDEFHRKHWAPEGRPARPGATKGALRRRKEYSPGVTTRPIKRALDR